ncbi:MAG: M28 family peptidase [Bacteroidales bacterium]|nr:M28 family peptidase [Bacteroidales bacterium]
MKKSLLIGCLLLLACGLSAQDSSRVRNHMETLTSRAMYGRGYAYHGDSLAANYILQVLRNLNLNPQEQTYSFRVHAMEGPVVVELNGRKLTGWEDYVIGPYSPSTHANMQIIPLDYRTLLDQTALNNFFATHKKSKNALLYVDKTLCTNTDTLKILDKLFGSLHFFNNAFPCNGFLVGVDEMSAWTVGLGVGNSQYVLMYIKRDLMSGQKNKMKVSFNNDVRMHHTRNICAVIPGTGHTDSLIVLTAHYDHVGMMGEEVMFPGCHDNASGTSAVLDLANYFCQHPLKDDVAVVFFSGEEAGLRGSIYFTKHPLFDLEKVKLLVNLDMLTGGDEGIMMVNAKDSMTHWFYNSLVQHNETNHWVKEVKARDNAANSDHFPFTEKGVPAVFVYTLGKYGGYHDPYDTAERATLFAYSGIARLLIQAMEEIR